MSADNWAQCPKCKEKNPDANTQTLREDYEIGIRNGEFKVGYYSICIVKDCHFKFKFKEEQKV